MAPLRFLEPLFVCIIDLILLGVFYFLQSQLQPEQIGLAYTGKNILGNQLIN